MNTKLLFTAILFSTATTWSSPNAIRTTPLNINDYNIICQNSETFEPASVYANTYSFNLALAESNEAPTLAELETLLVQPVAKCKLCYDITVATPKTHNHIYVARLRTNNPDDEIKNYSLSLDEVDQNQEITTLIDRADCQKLSISRSRKNH